MQLVRQQRRRAPGAAVLHHRPMLPGPMAYPPHKTESKGSTHLCFLCRLAGFVAVAASGLSLCRPTLGARHVFIVGLFKKQGWGGDGERDGSLVPVRQNIREGGRRADLCVFVCV